MTDACPRVAVLYNAPILPPGHPDAIAEADVVAVARSVADALGQYQFEAVLVSAVAPVELTIGRLRDAKPEVVFNLIEGFDGSSVGANVITGLIELLGWPMTGSPADALTWCLSKGRTKALLRGLGLPTASFAVVDPGEPVPHWEGPWPVFVKPDGEDASLGIDQGSVASDPRALTDRVEWIQARYGSRVLVEAYLPGPEFNVGLIGLPQPEPLPIAEVAFVSSPGTWPILTYDAKWAVGSIEDLSSPIRCPASIEGDMAGLLGRLSVAAYLATGCRDYARVDFRLDDRGAPMILEVNPNPDIGPSAGWARALQVSGRDYAETLARLARQALRRSPCRGRAGRGSV